MIKEYLIDYIREFYSLTAEMAPYLLVGFLFAGLLHGFFPKRLVQRTIGKPNLRSVINASILGVPLPLCSCGVLPTGIGFRRNGASKGATVSFLISTPQTGVDSIAATYAMLGWPLAIIRPLVALFTGIFGGALANRFSKPEAGDPNAFGNGEGTSGNRSLRSILHYGFVEMVQDIAKWLVIGLLIAALLAMIIPDGFFVSTVSNEYLSMLIILAASLPLYVCATGSIPIAAVLLMKGLSPGAALVFLMAGPATNAAAIAVIGNSLGRRTLMIYLASIIGGALAFGVIINEFIPRDWIMNAIPHHAAEGHGHHTGLIGTLSAIALIVLIINAFYLRFRPGKEETKPMNMKEYRVYKVEGMTCNHCKASVENGIRGLDAEGEVLADPNTNELRVSSGRISEEAIRSTVESLGYQFKGKKSD